MRKTKAARPARFTVARLRSAPASVLSLLLPFLLPFFFIAADEAPQLPPHADSARFLETLSESERAWLSAHPVIRVVQDPNYYPVEFEDREGNPAGISADYLFRVEELLGIRFEWTTGIPWQEAYELLKNWKIDMTTCVAATPEREEFWAFTEPYLTIPVVIATRTDVTYIADMEELEGKEVAVVDGYAAQEWIRRDYPGITLVPVATIEAGLDLVTTERAYAFIDNLLLIGSALSKQRNTAVKIAGNTPYVNAQRMAVRKDWVLLAGILQKALESIPEAAQHEIYKKWVPVRFEYGLDRTLLRRVIPPAAAVLALLLLWILGLRMEIRRKKRAEAALRAEHRRLENILEATQAGTWEWNVRTGEIIVNSQWGLIIGYEPGELPAISIDTLDRFIHPEDMKALAPLLERHLRGETSCLAAEIRMKNKNGTWTWLHTHGSVIGRDPDGGPLMMFGAHFDISESKKAEEDLKRNLAEKAILLREVHHRVKNNLNLFYSLLNLQAARIKDPAQALESIRNMRNRVLAMSLVYEELYSARDYSVVDMGRYIKKLADQLSAAYKTADRISVRTESDPVSLSLNESIPFGLILNELIANSLCHAFPGAIPGEISVSLRREEAGGLALSISDTGVGLPLPAGEWAEGNVGGKLGLSLVHLLVKQLDGSIESIREQGGGARWVIRFPMEDPA